MLIVLFNTSFTSAAPLDDVYSLGPDSAPHPGVPQGRVIGPMTLASNVYPNTTRNYWVYVPAQYDQSTPASLMIFQDGHAFVGLQGDYRIPYVFDNLIYRREIPVTIGVFINPGHRPDQREASDRDWGDGSTNRRVEYNALDDKYSKLIIDELLPELKKQYNLSPNPDDHAIAGASSGAICAFTVAWQRPDQFSKVISTIGSFTNIMGGHVYPDLILQNERKPIRVFLQDGLNDNRGMRGRGPDATYDPKWDWHSQNIKMAAALTQKQYDLNYTWGIGTHSNKQGGAIMPDMLRWLWRDYPRTDDPKDNSERTLRVSAGLESIVIPGQDWEQVGGDYKLTSGATADAQGNVYLSDVMDNKIYRVGMDGKLAVWVEKSDGADGIRIGPDEKLYACQNRNKRVATFDLATGKQEVIAQGIDQCNDLAVDRAGRVYVTGSATQKVWYISPDHKTRVVDEGLKFPNGIGFSTDQGRLIVDDMRGTNVYVYDVQDDGTLARKRPFSVAETPSTEKQSGADGLCVDTEGRVYVTSRLGIQVFDQGGRLLGIINKPHGMPLTSVILGGKNFDMLYITCGSRVYRCKTRAQGVHGFGEPAKSRSDNPG